MDLLEILLSLLIIALFIAHLHWYRCPKYKYDKKNPVGSFIITTKEKE
jgi:hypothetical protein